MSGRIECPRCRGRHIRGAVKRAYLRLHQPGGSPPSADEVAAEAMRSPRSRIADIDREEVLAEAAIRLEAERAWWLEWVPAMAKADADGVILAGRPVRPFPS